MKLWKCTRGDEGPSKACSSSPLASRFIEWSPWAATLSASANCRASLSGAWTAQVGNVVHACVRWLSINFMNSMLIRDDGLYI